MQEEFLKFLEPFERHTRLHEIGLEIQEYAKDKPHIIFTTSLTGKNNATPSIKLAQRLYQNTVVVEYVRQALRTTLKRYGHRQKNMAKDGVEFKGLYHALRLIYEANDIYDHGEFKLPFNEERHKTLLNIKTGNINQQELFDMIDNELELLYKREKTTKSNKNVVEYKIDKLLFQLNGEKQIEYLRS
jgi:hypothetical protein